MSRQKLSGDSATIDGWIVIAVILGALLTATGAIISKVDPTLLTNGGPITDAARVYADYLFARNLPLAVMLLLLLATRARRMLAGFMVLTALIQMVDVINDLTRGDVLLIPGLLVFAIVFLVGAWRLFGQALWHVNAWRDLDSHSPESHYYSVEKPAETEARSLNGPLTPQEEVSEQK